MQNNILENSAVRKSLIALLIVTSVFVAFLAINQIQAVSHFSPVAYNSIYINGVGEVKAKPDVGQISFTITKEMKSAGDASDAVSKIATPIVAELKARGIEEKDIKTISINTYPVYDYVQNQVQCLAYPCPVNSKQVLRGYESSESFEVKIRNTDKSGDIISYINGAGVTNVSGLTFVFDDVENLKMEARSKAIVAAKKNAEKLASELGVKLVRIISFNEDNGSGGVMPYAMDSMMVKSASAPGVARETTQVNAGENTFTSTVNISYEIK